MYVKDQTMIFIPPSNDQLNAVFHYKDFITPKDCQRLISYGEKMGLEQAKILTNAEQDSYVVSPVRKAKMTSFHINEELKPTFNLIQQLTEICNEQFCFQLTGMLEALQFVRYEQGDGYGWHKDVGPGLLSMRKISVVIHLSDPGDFEGGCLQTMKDGVATDCEWSQGSATIMPSYELHRVTKITKGTRYSLMCWASGHPYK
ncbi:MAG: 2OG-Fe(II) oxygenase [Pseudomonadales bacterium]